MLLKVFLDPFIKKAHTLDTAALISHLQGFSYASKAITRKTLSRLEQDIKIFDSEVDYRRNKFVRKTHNHPGFNYGGDQRVLNSFLLGDYNWKNTSNEILRTRLQIF